jgi:hypothetical protein
MDLGEMSEGVECILLIQGRDEWWTVEHDNELSGTRKGA